MLLRVPLCDRGGEVAAGGVVEGEERVEEVCETLRGRPRDGEVGFVVVVVELVVVVVSVEVVSPRSVEWEALSNRKM